MPSNIEIICPYSGCLATFLTREGFNRHINDCHTHERLRTASSWSSQEDMYLAYTLYNLYCQSECLTRGSSQQFLDRLPFQANSADPHIELPLLDFTLSPNETLQGTFDFNKY